MKKLLIFISFICLSTVGFAQLSTVQQNQWGVGAIAGEPTGLSLKTWLSEDQALDAAFAWSVEGKSSLHIHASYLFHDFELLDINHGDLGLYIGAGLRFKVRRGDADRFGFRVPVGIAYYLPNNPVEIFAEVAPIYDLSPDSRAVVSGSIGFRFYFD